MNLFASIESLSLHHHTFTIIRLAAVPLLDGRPYAPIIRHRASVIKLHLRETMTKEISLRVIARPSDYLAVSFSSFLIAVSNFSNVNGLAM